MDSIFHTELLTDQVVALRLVLGFLAGAVIGLERAMRKQPAGLRTHILISTGATLLMLLSIYIPEQFMAAKNGDPGRIAAQVVSGIGFLGAGSILRLGNNIKGLTTAASIWMVAALGLTLGAGMYFPSLVGLLLALFALVVLEPLENRLFPEVRTKHLEIEYSGGSDFLEKAKEVLKAFKITILSVDVQKKVGKGVSSVRFLVGIPGSADVAELYRAIKALGNVQEVEIKEKF